MSTLGIQDVLNGISELFSMIIFIFGLWHDQIFEELRKGWSIANEIEGDLLLPLFLFMEASLGCDVYVCNFGIALYWMLVVMALLLITQNFFFFTICNLYLCCCHSKMKTSTSSYRWSSCPAAMGCSPLYFMNFTSTWYQERLILYSLYLISGPCSFSKFIACCITCHRNGTGSFSLMSPYISILNSKVSLYSATPHGLSLPQCMRFCGTSQSPPTLLPWGFLYLLLWLYPSPTAVFPCGNILFPFVLSIVAPGTVNFCIPCNILSLHPSGIVFPTLLPHLLFPSTLGTLFPSCRISACHIPRALCCPDRSLPSIVSSICIRLRAVVGQSVSTVQFVSGRSSARYLNSQ